jgi:hypothetical protein
VIVELLSAFSLKLLLGVLPNFVTTCQFYLKTVMGSLFEEAILFCK